MTRSVYNSRHHWCSCLVSSSPLSLSLTVLYLKEHGGHHDSPGKRGARILESAFDNMWRILRKILLAIFSTLEILPEAMNLEKEQVLLGRRMKTNLLLKTIDGPLMVSSPRKLSFSYGGPLALCVTLHPGPCRPLLCPSHTCLRHTPLLSYPFSQLHVLSGWRAQWGSGCEHAGSARLAED